MNKISQEVLPKPFETGLGQKEKEEIAIDYQLDKIAPFVKDFPYEDEIEIKRAGEARIYKVKRITDG